MPLSTRTLMMLMVRFWVHLSLLDNQQVEGLKCYGCGREMGDPCDSHQNEETLNAYECNPNRKYCYMEVRIFLHDLDSPILAKTCATEDEHQDEIRGGYSCDTFKHEPIKPAAGSKEPRFVKTKKCFCSTDLCNKYISLTDPVNTTAAASQNTTEIDTNNAPSIITGCSRHVISSLVLYFFF